MKTFHSIVAFCLCSGAVAAGAAKVCTAVNITPNLEDTLKALALRFPAHEEIQQIAHQHGVSYAAQQFARHRDLQRQAEALMGKGR